MALVEDLPKILGSAEAVILDDAYDEVPELRDLDPEWIQAFSTAIEDSDDALVQINALLELEILPQTIAANLTDARVAALWGRKDGGDALATALEELFSPFISRRASQLVHVEAIQKILEAQLKVKVERKGRRERDSLPQTAKIWFIDYYLFENAGAADLQEHIRNIKSQWENIAGGKRPILILTSSRPVTARDQQAFRDQANIFAGQFRFEQKAKLVDALNLQLLLTELIDQYALAAEIDQILESWSKVLRECNDSFAKSIRGLDVVDYQALRRLRLDADGVTLGAYLMWVYTQHYLSLVEAHTATGAAVKSLSKIDFDRAPTVALVPTLEMAKIYHSLVFSSLRSDWTPIDSEMEKDKEGMAVISLGDVLIRKEPPQPKPPKTHGINPAAAAPVAPTQASAAPVVAIAAEPPAQAAVVADQAAKDVLDVASANAEGHHEAAPEPPVLVDVPYLVMNPACDLVRRPPDASVILIRGQFARKATLEWPVDPEEYELIVVDGDERVLSWQHKDIVTIPYKDLSKALDEKTYRCVARMRPTYALKQQRVLMSTIGRVGTDVKMHEYRRYVCDVWFRTDKAKKDCKFAVTLSGPEMVALTSGRKDQGHHLYLLPGAIDALRNEAKKDGVHADTKTALEELEVLRYLRGPISLNDSYKANETDAGGRIAIIKGTGTPGRDGKRQAEGKTTRVLLVLYPEE